MSCNYIRKNKEVIVVMENSNFIPYFGRPASRYILKYTYNFVASHKCI
jgi:hypothetical protein